MNIGYYIVYSLWWAASLLPMRVLYVLSDALYLLVGHVVKYRHKVIWNNLKTSFPEKDDRELRHIERQFYRRFCDYVVETIKLMTISERQMRRRMVMTGTDEMDRIAEGGQSVGVYLGHFFNWEYLTSMTYWVPGRLQCSELYKPLKSKTMDKLFLKVRQRMGTLCISKDESLRKILQFKRQGNPLLVGFIADQAPKWENIHHWVMFLNHDTPVFTGTERIMRHTGEAVFYADMRRLRRGYYQCDFKLITANPKAMGEWELTDQYFRMLEETIRRDPANWLWSHNRWKRTREEFDRDWEIRDGKVVRKQQS